MNVTLQKLRCCRCGHGWIPRKAEVRICPKCKSPYWDRSRSRVEPKDSFQSILQEVVRRVVKTCHPDKIILFGSHASGHADRDSDLDLLIVATVRGSRRQKATEIDTALFGIPLPIDTVLVTPEQVKRWGSVPGGIIHTAISEGRALYERAA